MRHIRTCFKHVATTQRSLAAGLCPEGSELPLPAAAAEQDSFNEIMDAIGLEKFGTEHRRRAALRLTKGRLLGIESFTDSIF